MGGNIIIIGAGFTGLSAALSLARRGFKVAIYESDVEIGGLAGTFEFAPGRRVEKFYHHWFTSDEEILGMVEQLGLRSELQLLPSQTGLYFANSIFRLQTPFDLLRFSPLPLLDRIRTGFMALYSRSIADWRSLEGVSAEEWLIKVGGRAGYETIWRPLLEGKFGPAAKDIGAVWIWNKFKLRGGSRNKSGVESLFYLRGGFQRFSDALVSKLNSLGVELRLGAPVRAVRCEGGKCLGIITDQGMHAAEAVLATLPLPEFLRLTEALPDEYRARYGQVKFLANTCLVLALKRSLSDTYWLNVADPGFPFVGVIEHTNLDAAEHYGGARIAYLSKYLPASDPVYRFSDQEYLEYCLPYIQRIFPEFSRDWIQGYRTWRASYAQPIITANYSSILPPIETPLSGLFLATMAQIYPEDRGTNYAVKQGRIAAELMASKLS